MQLGDIQAADHCAAVGAQGHQALGIKATKSLAHRHAAHADFRGDVLGDQAVTLTIATATNGLQQEVVGLLFGGLRMAVSISGGKLHAGTFCIFVSNYPRMQNSKGCARFVGGDSRG